MTHAAIEPVSMLSNLIVAVLVAIQMLGVAVFALTLP